MIFKGMKSKARRARVMELLDRVDLAHRASHKPNELSGGEMQRVAIARSLANNPSLILADEPTGNLDTKSGDEILAVFESLWKQGHTLVVITHNPNISARAQRIIKLKDGMIENNRA
jgi:putative ABC transport system ATP-binding protein